MNIDLHNVNVKYQSHADDKVTGRHWEVTISETCAFQPLPKPSNTAFTRENIGSLVVVGTQAGKWEWNAGSHSAGKRRLKDTMKYVDFAQFTGIVPFKPALFLTKNFRIEKSTLRKLT